jgi:hypothetical protein
MTRTLTFALLLAAAACGGKGKAASGPTTSGGSADHAGDHQGGDEEMHDSLSPEMKAFHDLLAPLWHADKGPKRLADTCAAVPQLKTSADAVAKATPPIPTNADTWTTGTRALVAAVGELETACKGKNEAATEAAFAKVHDTFHGLMKQANAQGGGDRSGAGAGKGPGHEHAPGSGSGSGSHDHHH